MSAALEAVRRVNLPGRVERSVRLRVVVLLAVELAVLAVGLAEAAPLDDVVLAVALLPVGALVSWRRAGQPNFLLKGLLAVGAMAALFRFFGDVRDIITVEFARQPLASLFLAVQVLHGFDLPARRDLAFTLASSLTLVALAATNTYGTWFLVLLGVYGILSVVAMLEMQRSAARQRAEEWSQEDHLALLDAAGAGEQRGRAAGRGAQGAAASVNGRELRQMLQVAGSIVLLGALAFSLVPRGRTSQLGGLQFRNLPFSLPIPSGMVQNPGLLGSGLDAPVEGQAPLDFNPTAYFGFAQNVDLRTVGTPSDVPVLRIRADRPRLWRGLVFDTYTGIGWTRPGELDAPEPVNGNPARIPLPDEPAGEGFDVPVLRERVVQTVELLADTPNLLFAAADPTQVFNGGASITAWDDGTISTGATMEEGVVYSLISEINATPRSVLRQVPGGWDDDTLARWTQLPDSVPQRVHDLAAELTAGAPTPYLAAEAVQRWIGANTEYSLDALPPPLRGDVVDHFLFTSRQGWCEPIAASMTVLLRSVGIPARFATGFQPGTRNPITGVFDVKLRDAHAWVEVNIPGQGWVSFDPTGAVPEAVDPGAHRSIPLVDLFVWVRDEVLPDAVVDAVVRTWQFVRRNWVASLVLGSALAAAALALLRARREARWAARPAWERLERLLADEGLHRAPGQTPRQFVAEVRLRRRELPVDALELLLAGEEARRYGAPPVDDDDLDTALGALRESARG